jgi:adenine-specific DNA-methyltransferase
VFHWKLRLFVKIEDVLMQSFTEYSLTWGQEVLAERLMAYRKQYGQFLTPEPLAQFMTQQLGTIPTGSHLLDPAMGSGTLLCALIDRFILEGQPLELWLDGFELDETLFAIAQVVLKEAVTKAAQSGIMIHLRLFHTDFVLNGLQFLRPSLIDSPVGQRYYHYIIANPPYFKINNQESHHQIATGWLKGHTNIYTLFMELAVHMLASGRACFIVPRSFCSGAYFTQFRQEFLKRALVQRIHLFESRADAFHQDAVLQENLVISFVPRHEVELQPIQISSSVSLEDLNESLPQRAISPQQFVSAIGLFRIPTSELDEMILDTVDHWKDSLNTYDMDISTGPVIPFRAKHCLLNEPNQAESVPLFWMQHVKAQQITWPLKGHFRKPQYITGDPTLLVRNTNYVLLRRFSAKEDLRRLVAAPYLAQHYPFSFIGLENHLNYIYSCHREMTPHEALGLSALFNTALIDRYFRIANGNTQVNATELRALPLPPITVIRAIGETLMNATHVDIEQVVIQLLLQHTLISPHLSILYETRTV